MLSGLSRNSRLRYFVAFVTAVVFSLWYDAQLFESLEMSVLAKRLQRRTYTLPPDNIVVISVDDTTYRALGLSYLKPVPRSYMTQLAYRLRELGVKRIAFDFVFRQWAENGENRELAKAIASHPTIIAQDKYLRTRVNLKGERELYEERLLPAEAFAEAAVESASIKLQLSDGVARKLSPYFDRNDELGRSLAAAVIDFDLPKEEWPSEGAMINYYGPTPLMRSIPMQQVLSADIETLKPLLEGAYVLVGLHRSIDVGDKPKDAFFTPFAKIAYGVELHAIQAANLMRRDWIRRSTINAEATVLSIIGLLGAILILILRPLPGFFVLSGYFFTWVIGGQYALQMNFFLPGASLILFYFPFIYLMNSLVQYFFEQRDRREVERAFTKYVSPQLLKDVKKKPGFPKLGGERVEATALFTDLAGFTTFAEERDPEEVSAVLNMYFSEMAGLALAEKGTLVRFTGDGMYVLLGAPVSFEDHAERAVSAARRMLQKAEELIADKRMPDIKTRIGIHTGSMLAGNLGAQEQMNYGAIGDAVNTASRLEGACKHLGINGLCSEASASQVEANKESLLSIGRIAVQGRREAIAVSAIFATPPPVTFRSSWEGFIECIERKDRGAAISALDSLESWSPLAPIVAKYREQLLADTGLNLDLSLVK